MPSIWRRAGGSDRGFPRHRARQGHAWLAHCVLIAAGARFPSDGLAARFALEDLQPNAGSRVSIDQRKLLEAGVNGDCRVSLVEERIHIEVEGACHLELPLTGAQELELDLTVHGLVTMTYASARNH